MTRAVVFASVFGMGAFAAWLLHPVLAQDAQSAPRIPLVQNDTTDPDAAELLAEIRKRGIEPLNIHRTYANAPKIARQLQAVAYALRYDAQVPRADRELIILRATQNGYGHYQFSEHADIALSCGISKEQIAALARWRESALFSERQRAILAYADGMVSVAGVDDATFEAMKHHFSIKEIVELTMTGAYYNASGQITRALGVQLQQNRERLSYGNC